MLNKFACIIFGTIHRCTRHYRIKFRISGTSINNRPVKHILRTIIGPIHVYNTATIGLRVRAFFHKTVRVCYVYCNFKIGFTCQITVIFGTLKDGSLLINTLASNICFSYRNIFQNGVDALSKIVDAFLSKSSKFHLVRIIR